MILNKNSLPFRNRVREPSRDRPSNFKGFVLTNTTIETETIQLMEIIKSTRLSRPYRRVWRNGVLSANNKLFIEQIARWRENVFKLVQFKIRLRVKRTATKHLWRLKCSIDNWQLPSVIRSRSFFEMRAVVVFGSGVEKLLCVSRFVSCVWACPK